MASSLVASQIFGEASTLCENTMPLTHEPTIVERLINEPTYIILTIIFTLLYMIWLPHIIKGRKIRWSQIKRNIYHRKDSKQKVVTQQQISGKVVTWILCISMILLFALRISAQYAEATDIEPPWLSWAIRGVVVVSAILVYGWGLLKLSGYLTIQGEFVNDIISFRGQMLFMSVVFLSPLLILGSFANFGQGELVVQLSIFVVIIFALIFIRETFLLFMRQNFSILHWILYLCAVEILPLSFIWTIAMSNSNVGG